MLRSIDSLKISLTLMILGLSLHAEATKEPEKAQAKLFKIEGDDPYLGEEELKEDLEGLHLSLHRAGGVAYVKPEDLKTGAPPEPAILKNFKIAAPEKPSQGLLIPKRVVESNASPAVQRLQETPVAQSSNEGAPPAWVIEAKMSENRD